ncbi:MAG: glycosyltransferase family 2 protein [Inquilinus sp.]|nr:glycosyltransferase family 2 protein [Inquilinus sp.]
MSADSLLAILEPTAQIVALVVIVTGLANNAVYTVEILVAWLELRGRPPVERSGALWSEFGDIAMPITLIVPAYNEEATIVESVRSFLSLNYPVFDIVVVNDGSKDGTLQALIDEFLLTPVVRDFEPEVVHRPIRQLLGTENHPNLLVVDKANGGKADALNAGINLTRLPLFCAVDADSILDPDALIRAVVPFIEDPERTVAVGGTIRIANGCTVRGGRIVDVGLARQPLALLQTVEYLRAFLMARVAQSRMRILTLISGAFGIFQRDVAVAVGGFSQNTVGEDFEIVVKIHRHMLERGRPYVIEYVPDPVCWTEAPESLIVLGRQRIRWQRGALETFAKHKDMLFNPRYGRVGILGFGLILLTDVLSPFFECLGLLLIPAFWAIGALDASYALAFMAVSFSYGVFLSIGAIVLEELELKRFPKVVDLVVLTVAAIVENFGYRQINNVWRLVGCWRYLRGAEGWGSMPRRGFRPSASAVRRDP